MRQFLHQLALARDAAQIPDQENAQQRMHLAWRWFTGLRFYQEIPHHSTFSKNRQGRFQESKLFEHLFEQIVRRCVDVGLVQGKHLSVDGSFVEAIAAKESRRPREQSREAAQVHHTVRKYLREVEEKNPVRPPGRTAPNEFCSS
jgi:hypothetical protein